MVLTALSIHNLRNLQSATLTPGPRLNLICGANASGKTSLLEAIYLLGRGRSFRSAYSRRIVRHDEGDLTVFGRLQSDKGHQHSLGVQIKDGRFRAKVDGVYQQKSSNLAGVLPLLFISPDGDKLIKGSPRQRRRYIDWGLFHVEHGFLGAWQRYNRLLHQRNALLRQGQRHQLRTWDLQLIQAADQLDSLRRHYVQQLASEAGHFLAHLLADVAIDVTYLPGWPSEAHYEEALKDGLESDLKARFTQRGPHRADLSLRVGGKPAAEVLSGGQQKLAACALLLAQAAVLNRRRDEHCLVLVDDLPAELDRQHRQRFMKLLYATGSQLFVTATDPDFLDVSGYADHCMFHVEQGRIQAEKEDGG